MKQVLQDFKNGQLRVEEVPPPVARDGFVVVHNQYSLISTGTEGGTVKLGKMSLIGKARSRPEQVAKVLQVVRSDGPLAAYLATTRSLDMPVALGYSTAGEVIEVGAGVKDFKVGDLVACAGSGYANHAEVVCVPRNLVARVPAGLDLRCATFTTLGSIAMQSVRVASPHLGDNVVVIGLGLIGLLVAQLLQANGCNVFGIDVNAARVQFAVDHGFCQASVRGTPNLKELVQAFSNGYGADSVIITAPTASNDPVRLAGELVRRKARVVVLGRTKMEAPRETYLFKELELCTSMAYGPGTGDPAYEERGSDYPIGYVRWTENRNMESFLSLMAAGRVDVMSLITHEFEVEKAAEAFDLVIGKTGEPSIAVLLKYPPLDRASSTMGRVPFGAPALVHAGPKDGVLRLGVIGAGSHATNAIVPILGGLAQTRLVGVASATGMRAQSIGKKYGFEYCAADAQEIIKDPDIDAVFILSRHDTHGLLTVEALNAGKHVFVEKPLAMTLQELEQIKAAQERSGLNVMVGFNRRYAGLALKLKASFANHAQPIAVLYRANVGYRPPEHWLHDPKTGGGLIRAEACHFIDFCTWMVGAAPVQVTASSLEGGNKGMIPGDNVHIVLRYSDSSLGMVTYLSNGSKGYSRERVEVYGENSTGMLQDFRQLELAHGSGGVKRTHALLVQDKGFSGIISDFLAHVRSGKPSPVFQEQYLSSWYTVMAAEQCSAQPA